MNKEKIKKNLIKKWEVIEDDVELVNMIDDIIEDTAKAILEEVEVTNKEIFHDVEMLKQTKNRISIISLKLCYDRWNRRMQYIKEQFGVK